MVEMNRTERPRLRSAGRRSTPERKERIAEAAADIAVESGFAAVTMQSVATRAGYIRPVVYDCYGSPDAILHTVLERAETALAAARSEYESGDSDSARFVLGYLSAVHARPREWRLFTLSTVGVDDSIANRVAAVREGLRADIASWLVVLTAGLPEPADIEALSVLFLAGVDGIAALVAADPEQFDASRSERFVEFFLQNTHPAVADGRMRVDRTARTTD
ncbi:TetR/AcrR family transcriptional regulator [Nocardia bovistercoris]|uniref:TetR/AcrR family transcriptional regulator n=1 Tax=Nocardia bovistercoris TaxID=2785916 RepID=A0A931N112_9NOCA|nr:TetR/AcrR family transcriptional regulator [Nocardia bovistercoris]MBH0775519.1 TetR/AcrR family transcriptional regulator [Nocardia bovistercoris]